MLTKFYNSLSDILTNETTKQRLQEKQIKPIAHVALYESQYKNEEEEIAYNRPAVFIEFTEGKAEPKHPFVIERITIKLHIESAQFGSTAKNSHNKEKSLSPIILVDELKDILFEFVAGKGFGALSYEGFELSADNNNHPVHILIYQVVHTRLKK